MYTIWCDKCNLLLILYNFLFSLLFPPCRKSDIWSHTWNRWRRNGRRNVIGISNNLCVCVTWSSHARHMDISCMSCVSHVTICCAVLWTEHYILWMLYIFDRDWTCNNHCDIWIEPRRNSAATLMPIDITSFYVYLTTSKTLIKETSYSTQVKLYFLDWISPFSKSDWSYCVYFHLLFSKFVDNLIIAPQYQ